MLKRDEWIRADFSHHISLEPKGHVQVNEKTLSETHIPSLPLGAITHVNATTGHVGRRLYNDRSIAVQERAVSIHSRQLNPIISQEVAP